MRVYDKKVTWVPEELLERLLEEDTVSTSMFAWQRSVGGLQDVAPVMENQM